jgi:protein-glucosylgalactosylhydroxylysine glucosidase
VSTGGSQRVAPARPIGRRGRAAWIGAAAACVAAGGALLFAGHTAPATPIDRLALVTRHHPTLTSLDVESPFSVGNGEFAFTVDATGLQTFAEQYEATIPLGTLSQWGWHTAPNPGRWHIDTFAFKTFDSHGRAVGYADVPGERTPEINWLRSNPHRLHLGRIAFSLRHADGAPAVPADLTEIRQTLDLWNGRITSHFRFDGESVDVETLCHPAIDAVAVRVNSRLLASGRAAVEFRFPYGTGQVVTADWTRPDAHTTQRIDSPAGSAHFLRTLDGDTYHAAMRWGASAALTAAGPHTFRLAASPGSNSLSVVAAFAAAWIAPEKLPAFDEADGAARAHWNAFWSSGGAIDLSGSADPRWRELERRIVLSQYLTAIQCAGRFPPQETGLTYNSWEGKFHLEMHWWHAAHFALWNRLPMLERSLGYYEAIRAKARGTAVRQGYRGARWPKMTSPTGDESPSNVGPFLVWQQPHPIFYAELVYRERPNRDTLDRYRDVVFDTAEFMASFPAWDAGSKRFVLGPPLQCAQETYPKDRTINCSFELEYWAWGLKTAQAWRERLGLARDAGWDRVLSGLSRPAASDGKYLFAETAPDTYSNPKWATDHPSVVAMFGMLPGEGVDRGTMTRTVDWIWTHWNWPTTWGWDYPMVAMTAARLGQPERAIDALLLDTPKNVYRKNGHNHQRPGLTIYLPGNGGLLYAVAMMAAGWDGGPSTPAPGFPANGRWVVKWEGLRKAM